MTEQFLARNLTETILTLSRLGLTASASVTHSPLVQQAIAHQHHGQHYAAYQILLCSASSAHPRIPVFCSCCDPVLVFLRNNSLRHLFQMEITSSLLSYVTSTSTPLKHVSVSVVKDPAFVSDSFNDFLIAYFTNDIPLLRTVTAREPLFWEAFVLLADITGVFVEVKGPLSSFFYMVLKVKRDLDPQATHMLAPNVSADLPYTPETRDKHLHAAFWYASGNPSKSLELFNEIFINKNLKESERANNIADIRYFDLYAQLLYSQKDRTLIYLAEAVGGEMKGTAEALCILGIAKMFEGHYKTAKQYFVKSLRKRWSSDVCCMLGHACSRMGLRDEAVRCFMAALRGNESNFKTLYTVAQGFFMLGCYDRCEFYCQRALLHRTDGAIWKLMGRSLLGSGDSDKAIRCLEMGAKLGEYDAMLYSAEYLRKCNRVPEAIVLYEKYVEVGMQNKKTVAQYLADYYDGIGDVEKSRLYKNLQDY